MIGFSIFFNNLHAQFYGQTPRFVASDVSPYAFNQVGRFNEYFQALAHVEKIFVRTWRSAHHLYRTTQATETAFYLDYFTKATQIHNLSAPIKVLKHEVNILGNRHFGTLLRKIGSKVSQSQVVQNLYSNFQRVPETRLRRFLLRRASGLSCDRFLLILTFKFLRGW